MRDIAINVFSGGQSADADLRTVQEGDWVSSRNVINYHIGQNGAIRAIMGNTEMDLSPVVLPEGVNTCIGAHEDEQSKSLIWFNHNSDGNHGIYRFYYETGRCDQVLVYTGLDFDVNRKITDIATIDGRYLIWTDAKAVVYDLGGVPQETNEGLQPRCLDMNLSTLLGATFQAGSGNPYKPLTYKVFIHYSVLSISALTQDIRLQFRTTNILGGSPSAWVTASLLPAGTTDLDFEAFKAGVFNQLGLAIQAFIPGTTFTDNLSHLELTIPPDPSNGRRVNLRVLEGGGVSNKIRAYLAPVNHYYFPYVNDQFNLALPMPLVSPVASFVKVWDSVDGDGNPISNGSNFYGTQTQWTYRYHFYDGRKSAWSPFSISPTNLEVIETGRQLAYEPNQLYNAILLRLYGDDKLSAPTTGPEWSGFITQVEIAKRTDRNKPIESIGLFKPWELNDFPKQGASSDVFVTNGLGISGWQKLYRNNDGANPVESDEVGSTGANQVLKLYDWIPKRVNALGCVADETGVARVVVAGEAFGYKNPPASANITLEKYFLPLLYNDPDPNLPIKYCKFIQSSEQLTTKQLKKGGRYIIGVAYYDKYGVTPGPVRLGEVYIPYDGYARDVARVRLEFLSNPPAWADTWRICMSENLNQGLYTEVLVQDAGGVKIDEDGKADFVSILDLNEATHLAIELSMEVDDAETDEIIASLFNKDDNQSDVYWVAEPKDRVQVVYFSNSNIVTPINRSAVPPFVNSNLDSEAFNCLVVGTLKRISSGGGNTFTRRFLLLENKVSARPWIEYINGVSFGWDEAVVEVYRPSFASPELLKETAFFGKVFFPESPEYEGEAYHFDPQDGQSILLYGGDTYYVQQRQTITRGTTTYDTNYYIESLTPYAFAGEYLNDFGRTLPMDKDSKEEYNYQRVRISDAYTPSTKINGLSAFRGLNFIDVNKAFGPIMTLKNIRDDIAAVCWNKVQPIYVGKGRVLQLDGVEQIGRSSSLLQLALPLIEDWGTQNPESVVSDGRRLYGVDRRMCVVWRYSNDGMTPIGHYKNLNYFKKVIADTESSLTTGLNIYSAVHPRLEMFFFTLSDHVLAADTASPQYVAQRTWGFMETDNNWKGEYDFDPEYMKAAGVHLWTFKAGKLYKHHPGATPANFYGVQYYPEITFSANKNPGTTKVFQNIRMQSNEKWTAPAILIPANDPYSQGMMSRLKASNIRNEEGMFVADFLRDMNDPDFADIVSPSERQTNALLRGRNLRGEVIVVTLLGTPTADLIRVDTEFFMSMKTN